MKTGKTGHTEVVRIVYDPSKIDYATLLKHFWENHNPTQGMRQQGDIGTNYRSAIFYFNDKQKELAIETRKLYDKLLIENNQNNKNQITTEINDISNNPFYYAEDYHQQYLFKNPDGYCGLKHNGVDCPILRNEL